MKVFLEKYYNILFATFLLIIVCLTFAFGYQYRGSKKSSGNIVFSCPANVLEAQQISLPAETSNTNIATQTAAAINSISSTGTSSDSQGMYVGSKNGTKYYTPGCAGSKRIKPENYVWFQSLQDATLQGYTKGSC